MNNEQLLQIIEEILVSANKEQAEKVFIEYHPADIAEVLNELGPDQIQVILNLVDSVFQAAVFSYFSKSLQVKIAAHISKANFIKIFNSMSADDKADLYNLLPVEYGDEFMQQMAQAERDEIKNLASYAENVVGSIMTSNYATLTPDLTAKDAMDHLRKIAPDAETIYLAFVIDEKRQLLGYVPLRKLLVSAAKTLVKDLMMAEVKSVTDDYSIDGLHEIISRYDLLAVPVVNHQNQLVGIVTYDDILDVEKKKTDTDFGKVAAISELAINFKDASIALLYKKRIYWLIILIFANIFSGAGLVYFETVLEDNTSLFFFLPILIASGGNSGSQTATLMIRSLATGEIKFSDWTYVLRRELIISSCLGLTMAIVAGALGLGGAGWKVACVVTITMMLIVILGSMIGLILPLILSKFKLDPASASSPLITSIADSSGVMIYFMVARLIL